MESSQIRKSLHLNKVESFGLPQYGLRESKDIESMFNLRGYTKYKRIGGNFGTVYLLKQKRSTLRRRTKSPPVLIAKVAALNEDNREFWDEVIHQNLGSSSENLNDFIENELAKSKKKVLKKGYKKYLSFVCESVKKEINFLRNITEIQSMGSIIQMDCSILYLEYCVCDARNILWETVSSVDFEERKCCLRSDPKTVIYICSAALLGLNHMNNMEYVHLDLKPENILISTNGIPKLADFGSVEKISDLENLKRDEIVHTENFAAPEMYDYNFDLTEKADIFSLGITALDLLGLKDPFYLNMFELEDQTKEENIERIILKFETEFLKQNNNSDEVELVLIFFKAIREMLILDPIYRLSAREMSEKYIVWVNHDLWEKIEEKNSIDGAEVFHEVHSKFSEIVDGMLYTRSLGHLIPRNRRKR
eukprot:snap_masked-scaffold_23-processed-gene-4.5-mRNA-1 protein AED:0.40 eAED:0.43 QI:0/0/0/0.5/1/1/2/0/420